MKNIENIIKKYCMRRKGIKAAYIFGSFVKDKTSRFSDIDIAILAGKDIGYGDYADFRIRFINDLSSLIEREVDVIILNEASPYLKYNIFKEGRLIYERDMLMNRRFRAASLLEYFDFEPVKRFLEGAVIRKLREA